MFISENPEEFLRIITLIRRSLKLIKTTANKSKWKKCLPDAVVEDDVVADSILFSLLFLLRFDCLPDTQLIDVPVLAALLFFLDLNSFILACDMLFWTIGRTMNHSAVMLNMHNE